MRLLRVNYDTYYVIQIIENALQAPLFRISIAPSDHPPSTGNGAAQIILAGQGWLRCRSLLHGVAFLSV